MVSAARRRQAPTPAPRRRTRRCRRAPTSSLIALTHPARCSSRCVLAGGDTVGSVEAAPRSRRRADQLVVEPVAAGRRARGAAPDRYVAAHQGQAAAVVPPQRDGQPGRDGSLPDRRGCWRRPFSTRSQATLRISSRWVGATPSTCVPVIFVASTRGSTVNDTPAGMPRRLPVGGDVGVGRPVALRAAGAPAPGRRESRGPGTSRARTDETTSRFLKRRTKSRCFSTVDGGDVGLGAAGRSAASDARPTSAKASSPGGR